MDWANERYVRLYTRDTATWKLLDWRARTVLLHLIRKVDRAGVLDVGDDGLEGLAAVLELPIEIVEPGIQQLTRVSRGAARTATVMEVGAGERVVAYILPNFIEAQETPQSDPQRKRESRARRRDLAMRSRFVTGAADQLALPPGDHAEEGSDQGISASGSVPGQSRFVTGAAGFVPEPGRPVTSGHSYPDPDPTLTQETHSRARAIPPTTKYVPGTEQILDRWWEYQRTAHRDVKKQGIEPGTPDLWPQPPDSVKRDMLACLKAARAAGVPEAELEAQGRHRIDVAKAEAKRDRKLQYFKSMLLWDVDQFVRACETSVAAAGAPKRAVAAGPSEIRIVRDDDRPPPIPKHMRGGS